MKKNTSVAVESPQLGLFSGSSAPSVAAPAASASAPVAVAPSRPVGGSSPAVGPAIGVTLGEFNPGLHQRQRFLEQHRVLAFIKRRIQRQWGLTKVVGSWVWVIATDTLTELESSMLFELGFHWNSRPRVWQHPCGVPSPCPRRPFLSFFPAEVEA